MNLKQSQESQTLSDSFVGWDHWASSFVKVSLLIFGMGIGSLMVLIFQNWGEFPALVVRAFLIAFLGTLIGFALLVAALKVHKDDEE